MKFLKSLALLALVGTFFAVGCSKATDNDNNNDSDSDTANTTTDGIDFDAMSKAACDCMSDMFAIVKEVAAAQEEGNMEKVTELAGKMTEVEAEGAECMKALESKYGAMEGENEEKAEAAMKKNCPEYAAMSEEME